ncbi:hypothetical protein BGZ81_003281, partial [Podila clonocystis]
KLGQKLQRLDEENSQLSLPLDRESATRVPRTRNPEEEGEVILIPPPDYQASIITPPAYIVAPRKCSATGHWRTCLRLRGQGASG